MQLVIDKLQREFAMTDNSFLNNIERRGRDGLRFQIARSVAKNNKSCFGHVHHLGPVIRYSPYLTYVACLSLRNGNKVSRNAVKSHSLSRIVGITPISLNYETRTKTA